HVLWYCASCSLHRYSHQLDAAGHRPPYLLCSRQPLQVAAGLIGSTIWSAGGGVLPAAGSAGIGGGPAGAPAGIGHTGAAPTTTARASVVPRASTSVAATTRPTSEQLVCDHLRVITRPALAIGVVTLKKGKKLLRVGERLSAPGPDWLDDSAKLATRGLGCLPAFPDLDHERLHRSAH